ncbi:hypothetical protein [Heyndrickxia acidicola]|uniref:Uncharacterized protein n=1 Tax=Heyndrickxia acidicola TaxID=209389 RepID=A0ABU6MJ55_9BACI|nr:hypothetical protein [Heyndrickxia acidicola]MED1204698.1 hypothetical protein [Heyndrickxia acidicola]
MDLLQFNQTIDELVSKELLKSILSWGFFKAPALFLIPLQSV